MVEQTLIRVLQDTGIWGSGQICLVAVSGGMDSVTLLHGLNKLSIQGQFKLRVAHLNHLLREEAGSDADFVRELCSRYGLPCTVGRANVSKWAKGQSLEMAARTIRHDFLQQTARAYKASYIFLAHHGNDQAETLLLRLARGTSLTGLAGIRLMQGNLVRPFLTLQRRDLAQYARVEGLRWVEDISNQDERYARNRVRHEIIPQMEMLNPACVEAMSRTARLLARDEDFIAQLADKAASSVKEFPEGVRWPCQELSPALLSRVVVRMMAISGMNVIENEDVEAVMSLALHGHNGERFCLPQGRMAYREKDALVIYQKTLTFKEEETPLPLPGCCEALKAVWKVSFIEGNRGVCMDHIQCFDEETFPHNAVIRTRREGDMIFPLGSPGKMTLKKAMNARGLPALKRDGWPLVASDDRILWVPGAHLMDDHLKFTNNTNKLVMIQYQGGHFLYGSHT